MIIFINGSFGVGKTTIAQKLAHQIQNSLLFDAEEVGLMLRNILTPIDWSGDFQDYTIWRSLVIEIAAKLIQQYQRTLIMPMTIWRREYFEEIMSGLSNLDLEIRHYCLTAPEDVIRKRILDRGEQQEGDWTFDQIGKCIASFESDLFAVKINTAAISPQQVFEQILADLSAKSIAV